MTNGAHPTQGLKRQNKNTNRKNRANDPKASLRKKGWLGASAKGDASHEASRSAQRE